MSLRTNQGPRFNDVLFMGDDHRASDVFINGAENIYPLIVRRGDLTFWQVIHDFPIPDRVKTILHRAGFSGVIDCGHHNIDRALIHALVERWRPETHTFHLPFGEATVTLQDVNVLFGLPVEGEVVTGLDRRHTSNVYADMCQKFLGYTPLPIDIKDGRLKVSSLTEQLQSVVDVNSLDACNARARIIIMCLFGGTLFPDSSTGWVPLIYLSHLENISLAGRFSWGSAMLACLYRNLCKAASKDAREITGPMYLLQLWAWERISVVAPTRYPQQYGPFNGLGVRWRYVFSVVETATHVLKTYRSQLEALSENRFNWTPYNGINLPATCTSGAESWKSRCCLILWEVVETHLPERVLRQFGLRQGIPPNVALSVEEHRRLHALKRTGGRDVQWFIRLQVYVSSWEDRHQNIMLGEETTYPETDGGYMHWYLNHTIINITNPTVNLQDCTGYQNLGSMTNLMADGFAYVYQSQDDNIRDRISQVMELANQQHRLDLPTSLTTEPVEPRGVDDALQRARRQGGRRRRNNIQAVVGDYENLESSPSFQLSSPNFQLSSPSFSQPCNYEVGSSSQMVGFMNNEEAGTSSYQHQTLNFGDGFFPSSEHIIHSPTPSYTSFGGLPQFYTPTPMAPYFSQDDSAPNIFGAGSSQMVPPRFSDATPLPLNLQDDDDDGRRRSQRDRQPARCFTGGLLFPHEDHHHGGGRGRGRGF